MNRTERRRLKRTRLERLERRRLEPIQIELLNGVEHNKKHTETFHIPSNEQKSKVDLGDSVKVCDGMERFWVHIVDFISDDLMVGKIDNQLVGNQPYSIGDKIFLTRDNIIDVYDEEYKRWVKENHPTLLDEGETYDKNDGLDETINRQKE